MSNNTPKFNFGPTPSSTSGSSTPGLFGSSNPPGSSSFGGGGGANPPASNLFGGGGAGKAAGGGFSFAGFGSSSVGENKPSNGATAETKPGGAFAGLGAASSNPVSAGLGSSQTPTRPSPFLGGPKEAAWNAAPGGTTSPAPAGSTTPGASGFNFNPSTPGASSFNFKPSTTPAGPPPTNVFGTSTGGENLFGNKNTEKSSFNPFQTAAFPAATGTTQPSTSAGGQFGADQTKGPPSALPWGKTMENSQGISTATTTNAEAQKSPFSGLNLSTPGTSLSTAPSNETQKPMFGGFGLNTSKSPASPAQTSSAAPPLLFQPPASLGGPDKTKPFSFPSLTPANVTNPTDSQNSKQASGMNSSQTPATSAPTSGNLFNKTPATSFAAPSANVFSLSVSNPTPLASQTSTSSTTAAATTSAPFNTLFKVPEKPASAVTTGTSQPATSQPTTASMTAPSSFKPGAANSNLSTSLGASTSGPTPPAQSRLRNKTMDEILTRWASDLTKYTKEFQSQAETIAHWDQLLVENMSKISKLYISAVTAEKQTASVEMQLSAVENQQHELESWLTKYEGEVDEMLAKNGAGQGQPGNMESEIGGPDQERERTYRLAEKLGERLEDMGRDLGTMVEEINVANASLSKTTKSDEPITQIVRILNSHLSQLQAIDQGTVALQAKINAAQKASQGLGFPGINGSSSNMAGATAADDFYRSYMGRR